MWSVASPNMLTFYTLVLLAQAEGVELQDGGRLRRGLLQNVFHLCQQHRLPCRNRSCKPFCISQGEAPLLFPLLHRPRFPKRFLPRRRRRCFQTPCSQPQIRTPLLCLKTQMGISRQKVDLRIRSKGCFVSPPHHAPCCASRSFYCY